MPVRQRAVSPQGLACDPAASRGRAVAEPQPVGRSAFQRDRDRILHSTAFRRLMHKTQVFVSPEGDHFRTRLTHTLEVAQLARTLARTLDLDEDLAEAIALAHDLGHTPFGHEGEDVLDACLAGHGGFDHNAQSFRIVTKLERRYAAFDGLNLTWETLEGIVKHNGPLVDASGRPLGRYARRGLPRALEAHASVTAADLRLDGFAALEAQVAAVADDIAYDAHDIDDGIRSGLLSTGGLEAAPLAGPILAAVRARYPGIERNRLVHEATRGLVDFLVRDVLAETRRRLATARPASADDVRGLGMPAVAFSAETALAERGLKAFLAENVYRHPDVLAVRHRAGRVLRDLYDCFVADPRLMPEGWSAGLAEAPPAARSPR